MVYGKTTWTSTVTAIDAAPLNNLETSVESSSLGIFGDGSDGNVTSGGDVTLIRDMYYNNLTIEAGDTLYTKQFRVHVLNTMTIAATGVVDSSGADAVVCVAGAGVTVGSFGELNNGGNGHIPPNGGGGGGGGGGVILLIARILINLGTIQANGGDGANATATAASQGAGLAGDVCVGYGGAGGAGGDTAGNVGGAGGTVTAPAATYGGYKALPMAILLHNRAGTPYGGGAGGGGGAGDNIPDEGGGGGGGGGGLIIIISNDFTSGTEQCLAGAAGAAQGGGGATAGTVGAAGTVWQIDNG